MNHRGLCVVLLVVGCARGAGSSADAGVAEADAPRGGAAAEPRPSGAPPTPAPTPRAATPRAGVRDGSPAAAQGTEAGTPVGAPEVILPEGSPDEIERLRPKLLACYVRALAQDATREGSVLLGVRVSPVGDAIDATARTDGFGAETSDCVRAVLMSGRYASTLSDERRLSLEVKFVRARR